MINCTFENGNKASLRHVVVDVLVLREKEILLVKRLPTLVEGGKWALVGGFVGRDETLEQAALREVLEETGYSVKIKKLLRIKDSPDRPGENRQNISFVYLTEVGEKQGEKDWESTEVKWFKLDGLPPREEFAFDHFLDIELFMKDAEQKAEDHREKNG